MKTRKIPALIQSTRRSFCLADGPANSNLYAMKTTIDSPLLTVELERKGRLLVAVPTKDTSRLSSKTVERARKRLRKDRLGGSLKHADRS